MLDASRPALQAFRLLQAVFVLAPMVAGIDKFTDILTNWDFYLSPIVPQITHLAPHQFMMGAGIVEIIAGLLVAMKPKVGGIVVAVWLAGIIINLLTIPGFFDVALRDFGLCLAAVALSRLGSIFD